MTKTQCAAPISGARGFVVPSDMATGIDMPSDARPALLRSLRAHADAVSHLGAKTIVLSRFMDAALPHLTPAQRQAIAALLRRAMQEAIAEADEGERSGCITRPCATTARRCSDCLKIETATQRAHGCVDRSDSGVSPGDGRVAGHMNGTLRLRSATAQ